MWKDFENRSIFNEDVDKKLVSRFLIPELYCCWLYMKEADIEAGLPLMFTFHSLAYVRSV